MGNIPQTKTKTKTRTMTISDRKPAFKMDCKKIAFYEKFGEPGISGIKSDTAGFIHKFIKFNSFQKIPTKIPSGYKEVKNSIRNKEWIQKKMCNTNLEILHKNNEHYKKIKHAHTKNKQYFTISNTGFPFLVYIGKGKGNRKVSIYKSQSGVGVKKDSWTYIQPVINYKPIEIFIGKSLRCGLTKKGRGFGKKFDGNSILLKLGGGKYAFIGEFIYNFRTLDNIIEYYSPVGNNDVPYPVAIGEKNIYFMHDRKFISIKKFNEINKSAKLTKKIKQDLYLFFYGHLGNCKVKDYCSNMKSVKIISNKL